jgi:hypothetical protein
MVKAWPHRADNHSRVERFEELVEVLSEREVSVNLYFCMDRNLRECGNFSLSTDEEPTNLGQGLWSVRSSRHEDVTPQPSGHPTTPRRKAGMQSLNEELVQKQASILDISPVSQAHAGCRLD